MSLTTPEQITQINALKEDYETNAEVFGYALSLVRDGYQSDQQAITDGIAAGLASAVRAATDPLDARIADLQTQLDAANATIAATTPPIPAPVTPPAT